MVIDARPDPSVVMVALLTFRPVVTCTTENDRLWFGIPASSVSSNCAETVTAVGRTADPGVADAFRVFAAVTLKLVDPTPSAFPCAFLAAAVTAYVPGAERSA